jgi:CelD/BcsL family acetyltransferase involved in cellulose biosynthesis
VRVNVIHLAELGSAEIESWHRMQRATLSLGHPFLSPEYAITVGRYRPESRVAILAEGNDVIGFFPFEKRQFALGMPISGWLSACQGLIHAPLLAEALGTIGVGELHMGKGARRYIDALNNCDIYVGEGALTSRSLSGAAYRLRNAASFYALRTVRRHPALHQAADIVLRRSGLSSRTYGRILPKGAV